MPKEPVCVRCEQPLDKCSVPGLAKDPDVTSTTTIVYNAVLCRGHDSLFKVLNHLTQNHPGATIQIVVTSYESRPSGSYERQFELWPRMCMILVGPLGTMK